MFVRLKSSYQKYDGKEIDRINDHGCMAYIVPCWISVEDRLPETRGLYLVYDGYSVYAAEYVPDREEGVWTDDIEEYLTFAVTHWMALPEPPEGVSGDAD